MYEYLLFLFGLRLIYWNIDRHRLLNSSFVMMVVMQILRLWNIDRDILLDNSFMMVVVM